MQKLVKIETGTSGCAAHGGDPPEQVTQRVDKSIERITQGQAVGMKEKRPCDVQIVAYGHILKAFVQCWLGFSLGDSRLSLMLEPGGICGLSYQLGNEEERALLVGVSFPA